MAYVIKKEHLKKKLNKNNIANLGYKMNPKLKNHSNFIEVKEIIIIKPSMKEKVLKLSFQVAFRRLFKLVMDLLQDDNATEGDTTICLDEIAKMKKILQQKYKNQINKEEYRTMWSKVSLLQKRLQEKIVKQQMYKMYFTEEKKGRGR